ncbi:MAG: penicillin-binding protein 2 [Acidobacteria bacterium]|nr:penicillin-binding protein 2 [Acidobacteriota bacterium]
MRSSEPQTIYRQRILLIGGFIALSCIVLLARLWYVQITRGESYREKAEKNRLRIVEIPAPRGLILDRNGRVLAENEVAFSLILRREYIQDRSYLLDILESRFALEKSYVRERLKEYRHVPAVLPITLKTRLSFEEIAFVESHKLTFPELSLEYVPTRRYVHNSIAAHVLGYVGEITTQELKRPGFAQFRQGDIIGKSGLERYYNQPLLGKKGQKHVYINSIGQVTGLLEETPALKGEDLRTSLDLELQLEAERLMKDEIGGLVALNPQTGEVYCMVSRPGFDPNLFTGHLTPAKWNELANNPDNPMQNKVIQGTYPPGSIYKILVALAALGEGVITPQTSCFCTGQTQMFDRVVHCWDSGGHGTVRLVDAIANSCNIYFYNIGQLLGIDKIHQWSLKAGFSRKSGIDLPGEKPGLVPSTEWKNRVFREKWYPGETISVVIGQGAVTVTPLQVAAFFSAVALNREPVRPRLLLGRDTVTRDAPGASLFPPVTLRLVVKGMEQVIQEGTGRRAALETIRVAGKTGTAQILSTQTAVRMRDYEEKYREHAWFACFAPVENPQIVVSIIVEHGGHGGASAAPIAAAIMKKFFTLYPPPPEAAHES